MKRVNFVPIFIYRIVNIMQSIIIEEVLNIDTNLACARTLLDAGQQVKQTLVLHCL